MVIRPPPPIFDSDQSESFVSLIGTRSRVSHSSSSSSSFLRFVSPHSSVTKLEFRLRCQSAIERLSPITMAPIAVRIPKFDGPNIPDAPLTFYQRALPGFIPGFDSVFFWPQSTKFISICFSGVFNVHLSLLRIEFTSTF